jgi:hypothetical protein
MALQKAEVLLGGIPLSGKAGLSWAFVSGTQPYVTTLTVHKSRWPKLENKLGKPLTLKITDSRGVTTEIEKVYIMHLAPSDAPSRVSFVVSDGRWKWGRHLVARDFNMPRKTGDRTALNTVPVETQLVVDEFDFLSYSLRETDQGNVKWSPRTAVKEVLDIIEKRNYTIESFPIKDTVGGPSGGDQGEFTLQGVTLRDPGDVALSRLLSYIPGASVYINAKGRAIIYDGTDIDATRAHVQTLPVSTYTGDKAVWVDRKAIRPSKVNVYYQRELEVKFDYEDDYKNVTQANPVRDAPYLENVCPTVDTKTTVTEYDSEGNTVTTNKLDPGTWVRFDKLLHAWDQDKQGPVKWGFEALKHHWIEGKLEGALGVVLDTSDTKNVVRRIQALQTHFRQTFRINRRFTDRARSIRNVRAGMLHPISGSRAPAGVWGQATMIPTAKGRLKRGHSDDKEDWFLYHIVDTISPILDGKPITEAEVSPAAVTMTDEALGIFKVVWKAPPQGTFGSIIPCRVTSPLVEINVPSPGNPGIYERSLVSSDMSTQDDLPMGPGMRVSGGNNGVWLDPVMNMSVILTVVPSAPNNERQFHKIVVEADDVQTIFQREYGITDGDGPELNVFVPPGEATARFAINDAAVAEITAARVFGLTDPGASPAGELDGYTLTNGDRELAPHSVSLAAELLANFADNVQGSIVTRAPDEAEGLKLVGNMSGASIRVGSAPSGKVDTVHTFPGQQRQISRLALMPESARQLLLGIVPFS